MLTTLKTLVVGGHARAEEKIKDVFAIELIDQHIRTTETGLTRAKVSLAHMIQRERAETKMLAKLDQDRTTLEIRIRAALSDGADDLAMQAADTLAQMENENSQRIDAQSRLCTRITRLRSQIDAQGRKLVDLKHGAQMARLVRAEQHAHGNITPTKAAAEAESLIEQIIGSDDPFEFDAILQGLDQDHTFDGMSDRMADAGYGPATRSTGASVLARLND